MPFPPGPLNGAPMGGNLVGAGFPTLRTLSSAVSNTTVGIGTADVYRMTTAGTTLTISAVNLTEGRVFIIRAIDASVGTPVTVLAEGGLAIDNATSALLTNPYDSITLQVTGGVLESIA